MHIGTYLEEHAGNLLLQLFLMVVLSGYLLAAGNALPIIIWILVIWLSILVVYCLLNYIRQKKHYKEIQQIFDQLEEKYLFTEIIPRPSGTLEQLYLDCSQQAAKAMLDRIELIAGSSREYKEYIESWIHEVKSPVTAIQLLLEHCPSNNAADIRTELSKLEHFINQALYYARSGSVEKDYFIREFPLLDAVGDALQEHRTALLNKRLQLKTDDLEALVYTDPKWVSYIISLLISNAVKYTPSSGLLHIYTRKEAKGIWLCIADNGSGIPSFDLPRICEKGFTGSDRHKKQATGMGLYLASELCRKLGLTFSISSELHKGTLAEIGFPTGTLVRP